MVSSGKNRELLQRIMGGVHESMDKLILESMEKNETLIIERNGKVVEISPFVLAKERWGNDPSKYPKLK